ncbi:hypothetical protein QAD02_022906 [Eretmocerus hayati]|uniref:Uncharacterized protein n=1 Tax=Eretmocerus hayati TaxID=131215 RepID=A0ACC2PUJ5_9HYME|nr:hypothetical protein QAD02_022906 [Eretmocerus hayati]
MKSTVEQEDPIQIVSQSSAPIERSDAGKIFIKNIEKSIDEQFVRETFSAFGRILGLKVVHDQTGLSKGYAIVHFETEEAANECINKFDGTLLNGQKVHVGKCVSHQKRKLRVGRSENRSKSLKRSKIFEELMDKENSNPDERIDRFVAYLAQVLRRLPEEARQRLQVEMMNIIDRYLPNSQESVNVQ